MILPVFFTILVLILTYLLWKLNIKRKYKPLEIIPGPKPLPIIGNALDAGTNTIAQLKCLMEMKQKYGNLYKLWIGENRVLLIVTDSEIMDFFLNTPKLIYKEYGYEMFYSWMGQGLLTGNGGHWHKHRKLLTPAFHFKVLESFLPIFHTNGNILINKLENKINETGTEIYTNISMYALDVICETSMGISINAQENPEHFYIKGVEILRTNCIERMFSFWKQNDFLFKFSSSYNDVMKALNTTHEFVRNVIEKRKKVLQENINENEEIIDEFGRKKRMSFLDILLRANVNGEPLLDEEIREEVDTFMFEGHDTTSSGVFFALYSLAQHPKIQETLYHEIYTIYEGDKNKELTLEDMNQMKYLDRVIKETQRLYPSAPYFSRTVENDTYYKDLLLPKGTALLLFVFGMQRDEKYFKNPLKFDPDRFLIENLDKTNHFNYLPFSAGPRNCIGQKYAIYEMKSVISKIIFNFEISLIEPEKPLILSAETILKAVGNIYFKLKKR